MEKRSTFIATQMIIIVKKLKRKLNIMCVVTMVHIAIVRM